MFPKYFALLCLLPIIFAKPLGDDSQPIDTSSHCGKWDSVTAGQYSLFLDQWGSSGNNGSSCASITSLIGTTIAWEDQWTWSGDHHQVKSYTNIQLNDGLNIQLSAINGIRTTWIWSCSSGDAVADVAYDLFTSSSPGGNNLNEVMIWLAAFGGAGPISARYQSDGRPKPVAADIELAGYYWNLYQGNNGKNNVLSFLPTNGGSITDFEADLNVFLQYLMTNGFISNAEYLISAQAGTEAFLGSAVLTTSGYSLSIS